jgi:predicted HTH transcriptional regulator
MPTKVRPVPKWANADLSRQLSGIREAGENEAIEFKQGFPEQAHRLGKEFAAFGTAGTGRIFVGIDDSGKLIGVEAWNAESRDDLFERATGILRAVTPNLRYDILFAVHARKAILVIDVPRQDEPVFYYDGRPYIRDGRRSRPATPDEVKKKVWSHPSAEYERERERIQLQRMQDIVDGSRRRAEWADRRCGPFGI